MTTAIEIITDALKAIDVVGEGEPIRDEDAQLGLTKLNQMMAALRFDVGYTKATSLTYTLTTNEDVEGYMVSHLAKRLSPSFTSPISNELAQECKATSAALNSRYVSIGEGMLPSNFPSGSGNYYYNDDYYENTYVSTDYTVLSTDTSLYVDCCDGPVTITLMAAAGVDGQGIKITKSDTTANSVIIVPSGSDTISGDTERRLWRNRESITVRSIDSVWVS